MEDTDGENDANNQNTNADSLNSRRPPRVNTKTADDAKGCL